MTYVYENSYRKELRGWDSTYAVLLAACFVVSVAPVWAQSCTGVSQSVPASSKALYRQMIASRSPGHPDPQSIRLQHFMQSGRWSAVFFSAGGFGKRGLLLPAAARQA